MGHGWDSQTQTIKRIKCKSNCLIFYSLSAWCNTQLCDWKLANGDYKIKINVAERS